MIKGKKLFLAGLLHRRGLRNLSRLTSSSTFVVFNYHRIRPDTSDSLPPFDSQVFGPSAAELERQVKWLVGHGHVLSEQDLIDHLEEKRSLPPRSTLITFDDGYRDNYTLAYPILKHYRVPAVFFIPTAQIDERRLGWWDLVSYLIKMTSRKYVTYDGVVIPLRGDRSEAIRLFFDKIKREPHARTSDLLPKLADSCGIEPPGLAAQDAELMTWEQIREMNRGGMSVGSHTHSHRVLATLEPALQRHEMSLSKERLRAELGAEIRSLSYPVGGYEHFTRETQKLAEECGYKLGFSFNTGVNSCNLISPFDVKRIAAPREIEMFSATVEWPRLFARGVGSPKRS